MQCPKCRTENRESVKFCEECGEKLDVLCPSCGQKVPSGKKFCGECGQELTSQTKQPPKILSFEEKLDKIQRYLPGGLTEKILAQRGKIEGERRQVTVMFCDMEGYTRFSENLGPEETYTIMNEIYEILIHEVHDYGGTVNELTGDGIMAIFGAPIAVEDAPQRAIRSSLAIHRELVKFSEKKKPTGLATPFKMRVGINTGPVVLGTVGNDLRVDFKAVGDTVNLASRMEGLAEPGTTYVTEETYRLTDGFFRFEAMGEREVKGREAHVKVYRVIAPSARTTRFDVNSERGLTPLAGRARELELLLDGYNRARGGRGQAFSIIAEAGVGKSRLLYEFRKAVANDDVTFLEGRCLSYSKGEAYYPVSELLRSNFDITESDGDPEIRNKVKKGLQLLHGDEAATMPYLLELLAVRESGIDKLPISPEARKERIQDALKRIVLRGSEIRPLILAVEDLHWMDRSSEEAFKYILESISGARVLLLFTYRPEFVHTWGGRSYHSQINLNRLSNRESLAMLHHLLGAEEIESNLEDLILERTEGVPLFIEELVKSLKDLRIIEAKGGRYCLTKDALAVAIPATIQDVIMARVDSLSDQVKGVLQAASVIGREFSFDIIRRVTGLPERELLSHLSAMKDSELVYERGIFPESAFIFKHALTQKVLYDSILNARKKKLHQQIGEAIEQVHLDRIDDYFGILSEHFSVSEDFLKAAEYLDQARKVAFKKASFTDAIACLEKRITCLERLPQTEEMTKEIINARTILGMLHLHLNHYTEMKKAIDPIVDLAVRLGYKRGLAGIYTLTGVYKSLVDEDFSEAFKYLKEAIELSEEVRNMASYSMANNYMGFTLLICCEFEKAHSIAEKVVRMNENAHNLWGIVTTKCQLAQLLYYQGQIDLAWQFTAEVLPLGENVGDAFTRAYTHLFHGMSAYGKWRLDEAERLLLKSVDFNQRAGHFMGVCMANDCLIKVYLSRGEYEKAISCCHEAISLSEQQVFLPSWNKYFKIFSATARVMAGDRDIDLESLYRYASENRSKLLEGQNLRYIGQILLNIDDKHMAETENWTRRAVEADKRNGMTFELAMDHLSYADLLKRKGDISAVRENLLTAAEIFKQCGADGWQQKAEQDLAQLT